MPELAAFFAVGFIANLFLTALFGYLWKRRYTRGAFAMLGTNLRRVDAYWSESRERVVFGSVEDEKRERARGLKTILITGAALSFLSWGGLAFQFLIMISYRFLARSRAERAVLDSRLAHDPALPTADVRRELEMLEHPDAGPT